MQTIWFNLDLHETCVLGIMLDTKLTLLNSLIGFSHIKALTMFMMHCAAEYCDWIEDFMFLLFQRHIPRLHLVVECMKRWINHSDVRSEEHTSELQSRETISYAVFCLKKKKQKKK